MSPSNDIHKGTMETASLKQQNKVKSFHACFLSSESPSPHVAIMVAIGLHSQVAAPNLPNLSNKALIFLSKSNSL